MLRNLADLCVMCYELPIITVAMVARWCRDTLHDTRNRVRMARGQELVPYSKGYLHDTLFSSQTWQDFDHYYDGRIVCQWTGQRVDWRAREARTEAAAPEKAICCATVIQAA